MRVLASQRFPGPAWDELEDVDYLTAPLRTALRTARPDVGALAVVHEEIDEGVLGLLPGLVLVANFGAGYDTIDVDACTRRGIAVSNTPGVLDAATAELTLGLIIAGRRGLVEGDRMIRRGAWRQVVPEPVMGDDVGGATLGIVGLGRIGTAVARRAAAFDMRIVYTQRHRLAAGVERTLGASYHDLDTLLAMSDIVTLHCPLTADTTNLIDAGRLALMRDGALLVNVARGPIVNEAALVVELRSGRLHAALDVFDHEPHVPAELVTLPNVTLSPHLGSATERTRMAMTRVLVDNLLAVAAGGQPVTPVQPGGAG